MKRRSRKHVENAIPILEEEVAVGTRAVAKGTVRVDVVTDTVEEMPELAIHEDVVDVKHVPIGLPVSEEPPVRTEGDVTIVPVLEEVVVLERRLMLKEELHIHRQQKQGQVSIPVQRRSQRAVVTRSDKERTPTSEKRLVGTSCSSPR